VPDGDTIGVAAADGDLDLPIGSVTVKTFFLDSEPIETRLFVRHDDGGWAGYTYEWDDDGLDATLLEGTKTKTVGGQEWTYPSRAQCLQCHGIGPGYTLGLELLQLNRTHFYPSTGRSANQLETLDHLALLNPPLGATPGELPAFRGQTLNESARAYMHTNCSNCHRPFAGAGVGIELQYDATNMKLCETFPNAGLLGIPGARLLKLDNLPLSILSIRMHLLGNDQMPPLARSIVDPDGTTLIDDWILSWISCSVGPDSDGDDVGDEVDNCPGVANPLQTDSLGNGIGDSCRSVCNDGIDNDLDGFADYPGDAGCASANAASEVPQCNDGIDNDGDGLIDSPMDLGCSNPSDPFELSSCEDGLDNDGDGRIDWDGGGVGQPDPTCEGRPTNAEAASVPASGMLPQAVLILLLASVGLALRRRGLPNTSSAARSAP
jgi:mono/diheme cytochrome c family protein